MARILPYLSHQMLFDVGKYKKAHSRARGQSEDTQRRGDIERLDEYVSGAISGLTRLVVETRASKEGAERMRRYTKYAIMMDHSIL